MQRNGQMIIQHSHKEEVYIMYLENDNFLIAIDEASGAISHLDEYEKIYMEL